jgi:hypothetical protein
MRHKPEAVRCVTAREEAEVPLDHPVHRQYLQSYVQQALSGDENARAICLALCKEDQGRVKAGELSAYDPELLIWLRMEFERCLRERDPLGALEVFLGAGRQPRGAKKLASYHFCIAIKVQERVEQGMSRAEASKAVSQNFPVEVKGEKKHLTDKQVARIHRDAMRELENKAKKAGVSLNSEGLFRLI